MGSLIFRLSLLKNGNLGTRLANWGGAACPSLFSMVSHYILEYCGVLAYHTPICCYLFNLQNTFGHWQAGASFNPPNRSVIDYRPTEPHYCIPTHKPVTNFVCKLDCVTEFVYFLYMNDAVVLLQITYMLWLST